MNTQFIIINGMTLDARLIQIVEKVINEAIEVTIELTMAKQIVEQILEDNQYSAIERLTITYLREHYAWTKEADQWFKEQLELRLL
jgi:hypothetical protein